MDRRMWFQRRYSGSDSILTIHPDLEVVDTYIGTLLLSCGDGTLVECRWTAVSESSEVDTYSIRHFRRISLKNLGDVIF